MEKNRIRSKLELDDERVVVALPEIVGLVSGIFENIGCSRPVSREVAEHLADSNLCGMESHGEPCNTPSSSRAAICAPTPRPKSGPPSAARP
jgi:hypothetical protein